jgi:Protein of unknown function (DUF1549)
MATMMRETLRGPRSLRLAMSLAALLAGWLLVYHARAQDTKPKADPAAKQPVPARKPVNDAEFVRRIYLDLLGRLPKAEEMAAFLADKEGPKREKLIDRLILKKWSPLEEMLAQAMKNNPDIRVAESKVREAEAELNRTQLQVTQKIVTLRHSLETQKNAVQAAEVNFRFVRERFNTGTVPPSDMGTAEQTLVRAKAKLTALEAELPFLLGQDPGRSLTFSSDGKLLGSADDMRALMESQWRRYFAMDVSKSMAPGKLEGTIFDKIRKARDLRVTLDYKNMPVQQVLEDLLGKIKGVPVRFVIQFSPDYKISLQFKEPLTLAAALQAWQDLASGGDNRTRDYYRDVRLVVRDYGILVTLRPLLPEGALLLHDFWNSARSEASAGTPAVPATVPKK